MKRLLIFSDLHGSLSGWLTVRALMGEADGLVLAGDLFDTRYGSYGHPDFRPEEIRSDLQALGHPLYYVYGNCDVPAFYPGQQNELVFPAFGQTLFLHHGHCPMPANCQADIVIQGHTHQCGLKRENHRICLNPGSIVLPRKSQPAYGIVDAAGVSLVALQTGEPMAYLPFSDPGL